MSCVVREELRRGVGSMCISAAWGLWKVKCFTFAPAADTC